MPSSISLLTAFEVALKEISSSALVLLMSIIGLLSRYSNTFFIVLAALPVFSTLL
jgi:hypothetical protein